MQFPLNIPDFVKTKLSGFVQNICDVTNMVLAGAHEQFPSCVVDTAASVVDFGSQSLDFGLCGPQLEHAMGASFMIGLFVAVIVVLTATMFFPFPSKRAAAEEADAKAAVEPADDEDRFEDAHEGSMEAEEETVDEGSMGAAAEEAAEPLRNLEAQPPTVIVLAPESANDEDTSTLNEETTLDKVAVPPKDHVMDDETVDGNDGKPNVGNGHEKASLKKAVEDDDDDDSIDTEFLEDMYAMPTPENNDDSFMVDVLAGLAPHNNGITTATPSPNDGDDSFMVDVLAGLAPHNPVDFFAGADQTLADSRARSASFSAEFLDRYETLEQSARDMHASLSSFGDVE